MNDRAEAILQYWLGGPDEDPTPFIARWFKNDPAVDEEIRQRFGGDLERATKGEYDGWNEGPATSAAPQTAALIILLDQFSRNAFRSTARAFASDARALTTSLAAQDRGLDLEMTIFQRYFSYIPMMHSEDRAVQRRGLDKFLDLSEAGRTTHASTKVQNVLSTARDYAERHARIIERFGRFPHRNAIVGRPSTPEEVEFLKEPGSSF